MDTVYKKKLTGYAETNLVECYEFKPKNLSDCKEILQYALKNNLSICCKGAGLSYADIITNKNNLVLDFSLMNNIKSWNSQNGEIIVESGVTFKQVFELTFLNNWILTSCPGSIDITIGGAVSNNVHGKDSYKFGNFGHQVKELTVLLASGEIKVIDKKSDLNFFNTVIGGMGLLGIIIEIKIQLNKIPSQFVETQEIITNNIYETIDLIEQNKNYYDFYVAWVDCYELKKHKIGKGYVAFARWSSKTYKFDEKKLYKSFKKSKKVFNTIPISLAWPLVKILFNRKNIKKFNNLFYLFKKIISVFKFHKNKLVFFTDYNFMHNQIPDIKIIHAPYGFLEFQPLIPRDQIKKFLPELFDLCKNYKTESTLCGLKLHSKDEFTISYSDDAYSVGIDVPLKNRKIKEIKEFANKLFTLTSKFHGKIYLAKDEMLDRKNFKVMYKNYKLFSELKQKYDPLNLFSSDLYRRII